MEFSYLNCSHRTTAQLKRHRSCRQEGKDLHINRCRMPFDRLVPLTEQEKIEKYEDLKREVKR